MIGQDELAGKKWALVECDGAMTLFLVEGEVCPAVLEEAWQAYRMLTEPSIPRQRQVLAHTV